MGYRLKQCIVVGVFNPSILLEGWISADVDEVGLYSGKKLIWKKTFFDNGSKAHHFFVQKNIPKCMSVKLVLSRKGIQIKFIRICTHLGVRSWSKLSSLLKWQGNLVQEEKSSVSVPPLKKTYNPLVAEEYIKWLSEKKEEDNGGYVFEYTPLISIVIPVYNINKEYLTQCIDSILGQTYQNFEICIADDCSTLQETIETIRYYEKKDSRIKTCYRKVNGHISKATNSAIELADGEFVGFVDHDDMLNKFALEEIVKALNQDQNIDFLYTDEDKLDINGQRREPHFKPDFAIDNLLAINYICHFAVLRKELLDEIGGFRIGYEGAQDYDLYLRAVEKAKKICHIPKILYHWRQVSGSTALGIEEKDYAGNAGLKALEDYIDRNHMKAKVEQITNKISYCVTYINDGEPLVDVVLLYDGNPNKLKRVLDEWLCQMKYRNYRVILFSDSSATKCCLNDYKKIIDIRWIDSVSKFNEYSLESPSEYFVFWDIDNIISNREWMKVVCSYLENEDIGVVGTNMVNSQTGEFVSGYSIVDSNRMIPIRKWYIAMGDAPVNRCIVGRLGYAVSKMHFRKVGGFSYGLDKASMHLDLQMKVYNDTKRNIVVPQVCFMREGEIGWEERIGVVKSIEGFVNDPYYNPNFSKEIAYDL